jgi:hypothetical protein
MAFDPISAALDIGGKLIDRLWPDPAQKDAAKLELLKMTQTGELAQLTADTDIAKAQNAVNAAEAANPNLFVSGWRPAVGWVCALGLLSQFIFRPFAMFLSQWFGRIVDYPSLDMGTLLTLLAGMLGLGSMRMYEKLNGVATK